MSDFLENLVARSLSRIETVRPQVISIFEPPPVNGGAIFRDSATPKLPIVEHEIENPMAKRLGQVQSLWRGEIGQGAIAAEPLFPQDRAETRVESRRAVPAVDGKGSPSKKPQGRAADEPIVVTPLSHAEPSPNVPTETPPRAIKRKRAAVTPLTAEEVPGSKAPNANDRQEENAPAHSVQATRQEGPTVKHVRTEAPAKLLPPPTRVASVSTQVQSEGKRSNAQPNVIEKEITETIVGKRQVHDEPTPAREAKTTQLQPVSPSRTIPAQQARIPPFAPIVPASIVVSPRVLPTPPHEESAPKAPSVYVTIGRVEVRATLPPAVRSRPQAASAPVMSLDAYLRQRAGGERR